MSKDEKDNNAKHSFDLAIFNSQSVFHGFTGSDT